MKTDMTKGKPLSLIIGFALPLLLSSLFQQFYNLADTAIVGHTLGDEALSAIGSVSGIFSLLTSLCFGMTNGFSILIAKFFGSGDEKRMKKSIAGTIILSVSITLLLTLLWCVFLKDFMHFLNTPEEIFEDAYSYIIVIVSLCIVMMFYNMFAFILRALGNSKIPLIFLIISSLLNIGLDFLFILVFKLGLPGAAYATVLSQFLSATGCLIYIIKCCPELHLTKEDFKLDGRMIGDLLASGLAMSLMFAVVNIGSVILQSGINSLGADTIAAHTSARKISELLMLAGSTLSSTVATFTSQNYGAGKKDRIWEGIKTTHYIGWIWCVLVILFAYLFANPAIAGISGSKNAEIIATGAKYLKLNTPFYFILIPLCLIRSTLQGLGSKIWPVIGSLLELLGKWVVVKFFIAPFGYTAVCFCEPATWIICCLLVATVLFTRADIKSVVFKKKEL